MKKKMLFVLATIVAFALFVPSVMAAEVTNEDAFVTAVEAGGTVTLGDDIDLSKTVKVPAGVTVTLELNNHTLTLANDEETTAVYGFAYYGLDVRGKLTINGEGTVEIPGGYGIQVYGTGSEVTINGGIYNHSHDDAVYLLFSYSKLTVNGGTFNANYCAVNGYQGTVNLAGGTFTSVEPELILVNTGTTATITGGSYDQDIAACTFENENGEEVYCITGTEEALDDEFVETSEGEYILASDSIILTMVAVLGENSESQEAVLKKGYVLTGEALEDLEELEAYFNEYLEEEGLNYVFKGLYLDEEGAEEVDFTAPLDEDTTWYIVFAEKKREENPDTGDINLAVLIGTILVGMAGLAIVLRKRFAKSN